MEIDVRAIAEVAPKEECGKHPDVLVFLKISHTVQVVGRHVSKIDRNAFIAAEFIFMTDFLQERMRGCLQLLLIISLTIGLH